MIKNKTTLVGLGVIILGLASLFVFNFECISNASCTEEELGLFQKFFSPIAMIIGAAIFVIGLMQWSRKLVVLPADGPVDVNKQVLHILVPGLDTKAAKRINKLKPLSIIGLSIVSGIAFGGYGIAYLFDQFNLITATLVVLVATVVYLTCAAYLIRKWSIEWNKKFK